MDKEILDIIARMIDPPIQIASDETSAKRRDIRRMLVQLPWALEYAVVTYLNDQNTGWYSGLANPQVQCTNAHFSPGSELDYSNADPYYTGKSYILEYAISEKFIQDFSNFQRGIHLYDLTEPIEQWMREHGLYETAADNPDPHFAERAFVVNVLLPAYGPEVLSAIKPQRLLKDLSYQVDFLLATPRGEVAIEIDGREYHDPVKVGMDRFEYELRRQNRIQSLGYRVFRYPARPVLQDPQSVIKEISRNIPKIGGGQAELFSGSPDEGEPPYGPTTEIGLMNAYCGWFRSMELAILLALSNAGLCERYRILVKDAPALLTNLVLLDLGLLIGRACKLYV